MLFCSGCVEGFLASEVILGQKLCGDVWEFSWLRGQEQMKWELYLAIVRLFQAIGQALLI